MDKFTFASDPSQIQKYPSPKQSNPSHGLRFLTLLLGDGG